MAVDWVQELVAIMARLREPGGCPWDREQTHASLKRFLVEETAELLDAIDDQDDEAIADELGDVLLQIAFHARIGQERGKFDMQDVARRICEKMRRRHPHVFAGGQAATPHAVTVKWDEIKRRERAAQGRDERSRAPRSLPALSRAQKAQSLAAKAGFKWPTAQAALAKIEEELAEVKQAIARGSSQDVAAEIGDLLFSVVSLSRFGGHQAEEVLHDTVKKFERRFETMERRLAEAGQPVEQCSPERLEQAWRQAKAEEQAAHK